MNDDKIVKFSDMNYAIYKIDNWENKYQINQVGLSNEIPVTKNTVHHVKLSMDEIRNSQFEIDDKDVNGFVAIALQLNHSMKKLDIQEVIDLEKEEYENICNELDNLDLLNDDDSISLDSEDYLIFKLEKDCHVTNSIPANDYTKRYYVEELKRIKEALD